MQELAMTEIHGNRVEINRNNNTDKVANRVDKFGRQFLLRNQKMFRHLGQWEIKKVVDNEQEKTLQFSKKKETQQLKISYKKNDKAWNISGFDFTNLKGESIKIIDNNGKWEILRTENVIKNENLSGDEKREIDNYLRKFKIDRSLSRLIDSLKATKKAAPALVSAALSAGFLWYGLDHKIPTPVALPPNPAGHNLRPSTTEHKNISDTTIKDLSPEKQKEFKDAFELAAGDLYTLGLIDDLKMTALFFSQPQLTSGRNFSMTVEKYLLLDKAGNGLYKWRAGGYERKLIDPLKKALDKIKIDKNAKSQKNFFQMFNAFMNFKGRSIVTPEKVMKQLGRSGDFSYIDGTQFAGINNFGKGDIKAYAAYFETVFPGELLVNTVTGEMGIIVNTTKDKVVVMIVDKRGQSKFVEYDARSFPAPESVIKLGY